MKFIKAVSGSQFASSALPLTPVAGQLKDINKTVGKDLSSTMLIGSGKISSPSQCLRKVRPSRRKCERLGKLSYKEAELKRLRSNEQERIRQKGITQAFKKLLAILPTNQDTTHKNGSKIYTLECATAYIKVLRHLLSTSNTCNQGQSAAVLSEQKTSPQNQNIKTLTTLWLNQPTSCARQGHKIDDTKRAPSVIEVPRLSRDEPPSFEGCTSNELHDKYLPSYQEFNHGHVRTTLSTKSTAINDSMQNQMNLPYIKRQNQLTYYPQSLPHFEQLLGNHKSSEKMSTFLSRHKYHSKVAQPSTPCIQKQQWMSDVFSSSTPDQRSQLPITSVSLIDISTDHHSSLPNFHSTPKDTICPEAAVSVYTFSIHSSSTNTPNSSNYFRKKCSQRDSGYLSCDSLDCNSRSVGCHDNKYGISTYPKFLELSEKSLLAFSPERVNKPLHQLISGAKSTSTNVQRHEGPPRGLNMDIV